MTLAYLLASNGVAVRVLERHPDFEREFRGELVQPSSVAALAKLGILSALSARGLAIPNVDRRMFVGARRQVMRAVTTGGEKGMLISQPGFLQLLHEACSRFPTYRMDFATRVTDTIVEDGRVVAVKTRSSAGEDRVDADLFVVCSGRGSLLRKSAGVEVEAFLQPADALWLRFDLSDVPDALPKGVDVHMYGAGVVTVTSPTTRSRLQIAFSAPGDLAALRKDLPELRRRLIPTLPEALRAIIDRKLQPDTEWQVLKVTVDRLKSWNVPGLLFLGDAAHTMSPSGGQGLNIAIRDAIVAANHLTEAHLAGAPVDAALLDRIQQEREPEVIAAQAGQIRAGTMVLKPVAVLHIAFTILGFMLALVMRFKKPAGEAVVEVRYPVPLPTAV